MKNVWVSTLIAVAIAFGYNVPIYAGAKADDTRNASVKDELDQSDYRGFYLEAAFGGGYRDVSVLHTLSYTSNVLGHPAGPLITNDKITNQLGWTVGGMFGYEFDSIIALEFGTYYIQKTEYVAQAGSIFQNAEGQLSRFGYANWLFYLAPKITFFRIQDFNLYMKFGIGLNHYDFINNTVFSYEHGGDTYYGTWLHPAFNGAAPIFGIGASYDITAGVYIGIQYMRFGTSWNTVKISSQDQVFPHRGLGNSWTTPATSAIDLFQISLGWRI